MSSPNKLRGYVALTSEFRAGRSDARSYLDETLARIAKLDPGIGAFVHDIPSTSDYSFASTMVLDSEKTHEMATPAAKLFLVFTSGLSS